MFYSRATSTVIGKELVVEQLSMLLKKDYVLPEEQYNRVLHSSGYIIFLYISVMYRYVY